MKSCYWCELAGEESLRPDYESGGIDEDTGEWVCDDCVDSAWEGNSQIKIEFHPIMRCAKCGGRMFFDVSGFKRYICESWLVMEGGCNPDEIRLTQKELT